MFGFVKAVVEILLIFFGTWSRASHGFPVTSKLLDHIYNLMLLFVIFLSYLYRYAWILVCTVLHNRIACNSSTYGRHAAR